MAHSVERPFVPHHTPGKGRPVGRASEFTLSRPFVPGAQRGDQRSGEAELVSGGAARASIELPGIEQFLEADRPTANLTAVVADESYNSDFEEPGELPPVEHFLDPLPPMSEFSADETLGAEWNIQRGSAGTEARERGSEGWLEADWQNYDWRAAAALGETGESEASNAWATTDWDAGGPRQGASRQNVSRQNAPHPTPAQAIASALDQIAQRIRAGELVVPSPGTMSDPSTIAATLAAVLGIRQ